MFAVGDVIGFPSLASVLDGAGHGGGLAFGAKVSSDSFGSALLMH